MFLMWQQQWHYIARAVDMGYSVLRADTDVYFAESPYPILDGPLLGRHAMVVQQDFGGPLGARPACTRAAANGACGLHRGTSLLNIGLVYVRAAANGGALDVLNTTVADFESLLSREPYRLPGGAPEVNRLIDQELMRAAVGRLSLPAAGKPAGMWQVVPADADVYTPGTRCALADDAACARVATVRRLAPFLVQTVGSAASRADSLALAPDWLFGRGCLTHVRQPAQLLERVRPGFAESTECRAPPPPDSARAMPAPGSAAGVLVATHFVYSMALKRKRMFRAFGWDAGDNRTRSSYAPGDCWKRSSKGLLFGHTFFSQVETKYTLCALPRDDEGSPECSCCADLPQGFLKQEALLAETTNGRAMHVSKKHMNLMAGCADYQTFWD